jgi:hypothetical protein
MFSEWAEFRHRTGNYVTFGDISTFFCSRDALLKRRYKCSILRTLELSGLCSEISMCIYLSSEKFYDPKEQISLFWFEPFDDSVRKIPKPFSMCYIISGDCKAKGKAGSVAKKTYSEADIMSIGAKRGLIDYEQCLESLMNDLADELKLLVQISPGIFVTCCDCYYAGSRAMAIETCLHWQMSLFDEPLKFKHKPRKMKLFDYVL